MSDEPKQLSKWASRARVLKPAGYGALFIGGALLTARIFGPRVAEDLGQRSGEGFAQGVNRIQTVVSGRRPRW